MFRKLKRFIRDLGSGKYDRPKRRFAPGIATSSSELENRQLLSAGGTKEEVSAVGHSAAAIAKTGLDPNYDSSPAGLFVINQYEALLLRAPTPSEVNHWVPILRNGSLSENGFRAILLTSSERQQLLLKAGVDLSGPPASFVRLPLHERPARDPKHD